MHVLIIIVLALIAENDLREHKIPNSLLLILIVLGSTIILINFGSWGLILYTAMGMTTFVICLCTGYILLKKTGKDGVGGGDFKFIAVLTFILGIDIIVCLIFQLIFEIIYRYILFPEKKNTALPIGTSLGIFSILILIVRSVT